MHNFKDYIYYWFGKQHKIPKYTIKYNGSRDFESTVCVEGYEFVGHGKASSKKEAHSNSAFNYCQQLVDRKILSRSEIPDLLRNQLQDENEDSLEKVALIETKSSKQRPLINVKSLENKNNDNDLNSSTTGDEETSSRFENSDIRNTVPKRLSFYDYSIYENDNEIITDFNIPIENNLPEIKIDENKLKTMNKLENIEKDMHPVKNTLQFYTGPYDYNDLNQGRKVLTKFFHTRYEPSLRNGKKYNFEYFRFEKLKIKLGVKRRIRTRFELRLAQAIKKETAAVTEVIDSRKDFVDKRLNEIKKCL